MVLGSRRYTIRKKYFRKWVITWEHVQDKGNGELVFITMGHRGPQLPYLQKT